MEKRGWNRLKVRARLKAQRQKDFRYDEEEILGSMCTAPHPDARFAARLFEETNLGDPGHFPGTKELEAEVLADSKHLTNAPEEGAARFLTGGTEANLMAMFLAREITGRTEVVLSDQGHFSFQKAAKLLGMTLRYVPSKEGRADPEAMAKAVTKHTALMVGIAGTTEFGLVDPIEDLAAVALEHDVRFHVDGAYGGYILPFLGKTGKRYGAWDFRNEGVHTISMDPHKFGRSTIPGGILVARDGADWEHARVDAPYVSSGPQTQILGTRPGAAVAACWAAHRTHGISGYTKEVERLMVLRDQLWDAIPAANRIHDPELLVVTFQVPLPEQAQRSLQEHRVRLNVIPRHQALRVVLNPHITETSIRKLIGLLPTILDPSDGADSK